MRVTRAAGTQASNLEKWSDLNDALREVGVS